MSDARLRALERRVAGPSPELVALARAWRQAGRHVPAELVARGWAVVTALRGTLLAVAAEGPPELLGRLVEEAGRPALWCEGGVECRCPAGAHEEAPAVAWRWLDGRDEPAVWRVRGETRWPPGDTPRIVARAGELGADLDGEPRVDDQGRGRDGARLHRIGGRGPAHARANRARVARRHEAGTCPPSCRHCRRGRRKGEPA